MYVVSCILKITGYRRENWEERDKPFTPGHECASGEFPIRRSTASYGVWGRQAMQCLPNKKSLTRLDNDVRLLVPEQSKMFCPNLLCNFFLQMGRRLLGFILAATKLHGA